MAAEAPFIGKAKGKLSLDEAVFGERFHGPLVHETVRAELAAQRRGTASTKTRGEIAMTGAKAWRQKGTGRARVGALSVSSRKGGGVTFGPKPRAYTVKVNRKARPARVPRRPGDARRSRLAGRHRRLGVRHPLHQGRGGRAGAASTAAAACSWCWATTRSTCAKSFRNLTGVKVLQSDARGRGRRGGRRPPRGLRGRARAPHREGPRAGEGECRVNSRAVILRPVVSEKSYALLAANKYTFRVADRANKTQVRQAIEEIFGVRVLDVRTLWVKPKPKRRGVSAGLPPPLEEGGGDAARRGQRSSCSKDRSSEPDGHQEAQAHEPGPAVRHLAPARGGHQDRAREVARRGPAEVRRAEQQRPRHLPPPRRRQQAQVPEDRLPAPQGRRAREGRGHRVRPQPQRAHRPPPLPGRREALHPGSGPARGGGHGVLGTDGRHRAGQRPAAERHPHGHHGAQRGARSRPRRPARPRRRHRHPGGGQGRRLRHPAPALQRDAHGVRRTAGPRSARSATPSTSWWTWARPVAHAIAASARRRAAWP